MISLMPHMGYVTAHCNRFPQSIGEWGLHVPTLPAPGRGYDPQFMLKGNDNGNVNDEDGSAGHDQGLNSTFDRTWSIVLMSGRVISVPTSSTALVSDLYYTMARSGHLAHDVLLEQCIFYRRDEMLQHDQLLQQADGDNNTISLLIRQPRGVPVGTALGLVVSKTDCFWEAAWRALGALTPIPTRLPASPAELRGAVSVNMRNMLHDVAYARLWDGREQYGEERITWQRYCDLAEAGAPAGAPEAFGVARLYGVTVVISMACANPLAFRFGTGEQRAAVRYTQNAEWLGHYDAIVPLHRTDTSHIWDHAVEYVSGIIVLRGLGDHSYTRRAQAVNAPGHIGNGTSFAPVPEPFITNHLKKLRKKAKKEMSLINFVLDQPGAGSGCFFVDTSIVLSGIMAYDNMLHNEKIIKEYWDRVKEDPDRFPPNSNGHLAGWRKRSKPHEKFWHGSSLLPMDR